MKWLYKFGYILFRNEQIIVKQIFLLKIRFRLIPTDLLEGSIWMSERGPKMKTIGQVAAKPRYSIFQLIH